MKTTKTSLEDLNAAFEKAAAAGTAANVGDDGGTCNFDQATFKLTRATAEMTAAIVELGKAHGLRISRWSPGGLFGGRFFVALDAPTGQAARNTAVAEAIYKALSDAGLDTLMYYQMD